MDDFGAIAHAQRGPELAESPPGQPVARRKPEVFLVEALVQVDHAAAILGIALVVSLRPVADPFVCGPVDVVDELLHGRHSSGDEDFLQAVWGEGEVGRRAEPTEALTQDAPAIHSHLRTYVLGIPDDGIGSEVTEVFRLSLRIHPGK